MLLIECIWNKYYSNIKYFCINILEKYYKEK